MARHDATQRTCKQTVRVEFFEDARGNARTRARARVRATRERTHPLARERAQRAHPRTRGCVC